MADGSGVVPSKTPLPAPACAGRQAGPQPPFEKGGRDHPLSPVCPAGSRPPLKKGVSLSQGEIFVLSNEINLRHILRNLLNNAIVYSRRGSMVEIEIKQEGEKIPNSKFQIPNLPAQAGNLKISNSKFGEQGGSASEGMAGGSGVV